MKARVRGINPLLYIVDIMPNLCSFTLYAKGSKEGLTKLKEIMTADYSYTKGVLDYCTTDHHFFRVWADIISDEIEHGQLIVSGDCAWSVQVCMFELGYYGDFKNYENFKGATIPIISKLYDLDIEIYSEEPGMCFQEHYIVKKGNILVDECVEWFSEYNENDGSYVNHGGFGDWEFSI